MGHAITVSAGVQKKLENKVCVCLSPWAKRKAIATRVCVCRKQQQIICSTTMKLDCRFAICRPKLQCTCTPSPQTSMACWEQEDYLHSRLGVYSWSMHMYIALAQRENMASTQLQCMYTHTHTHQIFLSLWCVLLACLSEVGWVCGLLSALQYRDKPSLMGCTVSLCLLCWHCQQANAWLLWNAIKLHLAESREVARLHTQYLCIWLYM